MSLASDRSLLLREIRNGVVNALIPDLESERSLDLATHIERLLAMLILDEDNGPEMRARYSARFRDVLTQASALTGTGTVDADDFDQWRTLAQRTASALAVDGAEHPTNRAMIARILTVESDFQDEIAQRRDDLRQSMAAASDAGELRCSFTSDQLADYIRTHVPGAAGAVVTQLRPIPGGRSKETVIVDLERQGTLPESVIIRKDRSQSVTDATVGNEYELLKAVHGGGQVPAPEPYWIERDAALLGSPFMIVSRLQGTKQGEYHLDMWRPDRNRHAIAMQMARALAHIHAVPLETLGATHLDRNPDLVTRIEAHIDRIARMFTESDGPPSISAAIASDWLREHADWGLLARPTLVHGDFGLHNLLIKDGRLTGVVDWELASVGSPAIDVAMCRRMAKHMDFEWAEFVSCYLEAGGQNEACDPRSIAFYQVYGLVSGTVRSRYGGHLFRSGIKRDLVTANSGFEFHHRSSRLLANALFEALALDAASAAEPTA